MFVEVFFFISLFLIFYAYIGYPLGLFSYALVKKKRIYKKYIFPKVTIVIAAYNEERYVKRKIENLQNQDYPMDKIEIIVVSDGSYDKTEAIVRSFQISENKIILCSLNERRGKALALNLGVSKANGEIIVFTDSRQILKADAIRQLVSNFSDASVGGVSGELFLSPERAGDVQKTLGIYWEYEKWIRKQESLIDSVIGVTGAIYAIRKELFEPVPEGTILDDVLIPMRIVLKGFRVVFDETAEAYDDLSIESRKEYKRKVRTMMGNFQMISLLPEVLSYENRLFVSYFSHKIMRLLGPCFLATIFVCNLFMLDDFYLFFMILQVLFYAVASMGFMMTFSKKSLKVFSVPYTFVMLNWAVVLGFYNYIRNNENIWVKN